MEMLQSDEYRTSMLILLNSSKHPQAPVWANPENILPILL